MSRFSLTSDLFDLMMMLDNDELNAFKKFKTLTNGTIYQDLKVEVTNLNEDYVAKKCPQLIIKRDIQKIPDSKRISGFREKVIKTYIYWNKEYKSLKELNKHEVSIRKEIHFSSILDLIPYYPYEVTMSSISDSSIFVCIGSKSTTEEDWESCSSEGTDKLVEQSRINLQRHYLYVVEKYLDRKDRIIKEELTVKKYNGSYVVQTSYLIDDNFDIHIDRGSHAFIMKEPDVIDYDKGLVDVSNVWPDGIIKEGFKIILSYTRTPITNRESGDLSSYLFK